MSTAPASQGVPASVARKDLSRRARWATGPPAARAAPVEPADGRAMEGVSVVEANLINQLAGFLAMFGDLSQWQGVDDQFAEAGHHRIKLDAFFHRILVVGLGVHALRLVGDEVLKQLDRVFAIRRMFCDRRTRNVDVRAAAL